MSEGDAFVVKRIDVRGFQKVKGEVVDAYIDSVWEDGAIDEEARAAIEGEAERELYETYRKKGLRPQVELGVQIIESGDEDVSEVSLEKQIAKPGVTSNKLAPPRP